MKFAVVFVLIAVVALAYGAPKPEEAYKSRIDTLNVDEILRNGRLVDNYVKCALEKTKCTPEGRDIKDQLKELLPEILATNCAKCTEDQKVKGRKILTHLHENKKEAFAELLKKFDPTGELRTKYKEKYSQLSKDEGFGDIFD